MDNILQKEISKCDACILYTPKIGEVDYRDDDFPIKLPSSEFYVPISKNSDPYEFADKFSNMLLSKKVLLLIPGTRFDVFGTRHGRGGGWYDRFLSEIPKNWIKIGVTFSSNFSNTVIPKNEWDEDMDWVISKHYNDWTITNCSYE